MVFQKIKKMRIGIEAQRLFRPHKHGMDRVAVELIKNLQVLDKENEYFIFVKPDQEPCFGTEPFISIFSPLSCPNGCIP